MCARSIRILLLAGWIAGAPACDGAPAPLPIRDFFAHAERGHFRLNEDGSLLAWLAPVAQADGTRRANVFVQALRGSTPVGEARQLTHESARDVPDIAWKGRGTLVFRKDFRGDENFHVVAVDVASGRVRDLTPGDRVCAAVLDELRDDPDHLLIASNRRDPQVNDVMRVDLRDGAGTTVARNPGDLTSWYVDHRGRVRLALRVDGLTTTLMHRADDESPWEPLLSTDFRSEVVPAFFAADDRRFYALSSRGRDRRALVLIDPARPDAERVVFAAGDVDVGAPAWSPRRRRLVRVDYAQDRPARHFFDAGTQALWRRLQARLPGCEIELQSATRAEDKFVVAADNDRTPGTRWLFDARRGTLTRLAVVNERLPAAAMAATAPVQYRARDGLALHGYLTLPPPAALGGRAPRDLPCVVNPHGGPWARDTWGWNPEVQFLASRGYCLLRMNFRGSTGYGRRFWEAGFGQWGAAMQDDVSDGARWLVAQGVADPKRVAIYGASYGGYAALAGAAFTPELYAAAVDYVGVSNLMTFMNTLPPYWGAEIPKLHEMVGDPARDAARLEAASPALHAERIVAPLLVAQGARDPRVAKAESDQMVEALRRRGVAVEYLVKEDEGHGFRNEENQLEFYAAMEAFLARHLKARAAD